MQWCLPRMDLLKFRLVFLLDFISANDLHSVKFRCEFCFASHIIEINVCQDLPEDTSVDNQFDYCYPCPTPTCHRIWKVKFVKDAGALVRLSPLFHRIPFDDLSTCSYIRCVSCCPLEYFVTPSSILAISNGSGDEPDFVLLEIDEFLVWKDSKILTRDIKFDSFDCFFRFKSSTAIIPSDRQCISYDYIRQNNQIVVALKLLDARFKNVVTRFYASLGTLDDGEG